MKKVLLPLLASALVLTACGKQSDTEATFPSKEISIVVPYSAGGGTDAVARTIAATSRDELGQAVNVVNRTGGGGAVGMSFGANAAADGHTVTLVTVELTTLPHMGQATFSFEDFEPVMQLNADPSSVIVRADAKWDDLQSFLADARENPGQYSIGNSGLGAIWHLSALAMEKETGTQFNHIPYDGAAPAVAELLGGHIDVVTVSPAEAASQIAAGELKVLGIAADARVMGFEDVLTFKEQGVDLSIGTWRGLAAPKGTSAEVLAQLETAFTQGAAAPEFIEQMTNLRLNIEVQSGEHFGARWAENDQIFGELIKGLDL